MVESIIKNSFRQKKQYFITRYNFNEIQAILLILLIEIFMILFGIIFFIASSKYSNLLFLTTIIISKIILFMPRGNSKIKQGYVMHELLDNKMIIFSIPLLAIKYDILLLSIICFVLSFFINLKLIYNSKSNELFQNTKSIEYVFYLIGFVGLYFLSENNIRDISWFITIIIINSLFRTSNSKSVYVLLIAYTSILLISKISILHNVAMYIEMLLFIVASTKVATMLEIESLLNLKRCRLNTTNNYKSKLKVVKEVKYIDILIYILSCVPIMNHFIMYINLNSFETFILITLYSFTFLLSYLSTCLFTINKFFSDSTFIKNIEDYVNYRFSSLFSITSVIVILPILFEKILPNEYQNQLYINNNKGLYLIGLITCLCSLLVLYIKKSNFSINKIIGDNI